METTISRKKNKKAKKQKKVMKITIIFLVFVLLIGGAVGGAYWNYFVAPVESTQTAEPEIFEFEKDESVRNIGNTLKEAGIIKESWALFLQSKIRGIDYVAQPGNYQFTKSMTLNEILDIIAGGKTAYDIQFPISDGADIDDILLSFSTNEGERMAMDAEINDLAYIQELRTRFTFLPEEILQDGMRHRLEGFLGNGKYYLKDEDGIKVLVEKALESFEKQYIDTNLESRLAASGHSLYEAVTMASVVRGEVFSGDTENQKLVAGVFYNRITEGMMFQSDVTVGYSLGLKETNYTMEELENPSPYNTYVHAGLPYGPINNPGFDVIEAALEPTPSNYYYFLADICDDGKGEFGKIYYAENIRDHNTYSAEYLACIR